jgi:hypothetical protein
MLKKKIKIVNQYIIDIYPFIINFISSLVDTNNGETSGLIQSSTDFPNRINASHVNNSLPSEQALRLYTQYIQEVFMFYF